MKTIHNAEYQLEHIMPTARKNGCKCKYTEADFQDFIDDKWQHNPECPSKLIECLPNPVGLLNAMRHL